MNFTATCLRLQLLCSRHMLGERCCLWMQIRLLRYSIYVDPANPSYPFPIPDNVEVQANEVATVLCGEPTVWSSSILKISGLTTDYQLLNTFVCHNIEPRGHSSDLLFPQAALLYYLGTGTSVDVALTIFNSMLRIYDETRKLTLPFGAMICKLLIEAGCQVHPHELPIPKRQKIDSCTKAMSESHVHNCL